MSMQEPQYVVPRIDIIEQPAVNNNPPAVVNMGRIGLVGTFSWGPVGVPIHGYSEEWFESQLGDYEAGLTGWLSMHGIFMQNATQDVTVIRIAGASAKQASGTFNDANNNPSAVVTALYPGDKPISVSWQAGTNPNTVKLIVIADGTSQTYDNLTLTNFNTVVDPNVSVAAAQGATALPAPIASTPLEGGDPGADAQDTDYVNGLNLLANVPVHIVLCAQQSSTTVQAALLALGANNSVGNGLAFPVLNMPEGDDQEAIVTAMESVQGIRGVVASPWGTFDDLPGVTVATDGHYAGVLANISAWYSPSNQTVQGLSSLQNSYSDDDVYDLTVARVSPITLDPLTGNYIIRNGVSTFVMPENGDSDDWSQINVRREFDNLETGIYVGTQWAKSSVDPNLPTQLATWIDNFLLTAKKNQEITDYQPTTAYRDSTNQRRVVTSISVQPLYAADFIDNYVAQWSGATSS
ncbi:hypothetical protein NZD89_09315 [Alicyclobacillus fastidiosus]|uniref:Phage tail sheath family protein n=1 Tax=Alicyclobacillus fastidiosus TaxID=392011 RepID=A0ABY6ZN76_9BACL|nr:phage tail sheath C-terminal domain-containing protein [Alicyclobacillus fastidiosus]WAH43556.1 hypothetical protein NZD89_09315 [Alicyclobacillus fastidiosus]GMA59732.1 hypothetical protein GCM10025859_01720 [Alicyclobacillus fastidiosus]